ncbi:DNA mismatch repair protein Mlh3 [Bagarius yarrelli]|uniref:DNA mismatch repair protein Mlh3 n=1 Tax=Bagarius yarrelli TaxID=175774 RepID=A0A556U0F0_BAGYA|nr:DNA mismatch repair protein Mlh3 [Bagarius yarrelli]
MIRSLTKEVQSRLRSGVAIFSLQQCVEELLLNSIDAGATCVAVQIDMDACNVQVLDNGSGIDRENMEKVGMRYCTSKCSSVEDLDNLCFYGFRGEAIASMATMATMVEITSRTKTSVKTFVKRFHEGKASDVSEAQATRPSVGTTVRICNIFHNMPVRRKRMDSVLEVERVRQKVEAVSLIHPSVSFTVKRDSGTLLVQLPKARNTYYRFVQIHGLTKAQKLGDLNHTFGQVEVMGHVGREGHYNNSLQFLFVNGRLLLKTRLHKLLNCLLRRLSSVQTSTLTAPAVVSSPKQKGSADLYGVYIINIKCPYSEYDVCLEPAKTLIEFRDWDNVLLGIEEGIKGFLIRENLVSECSMNDVQNFKNKESSPGGSVNVEDVGKELVKTTFISQDQEMPEAEAVHLITKSKTDFDSDPEKDVTDDAVKNSLQKMPENEPTPQFPDKSVNIPPLCLSSDEISHRKNSRISVINQEVALDSLKCFTEPNLSCAPKRKWTLLDPRRPADGSDHGPKIAKVTPPRKLTLSFETGSLDKFKRMFGKEAELKPQRADGCVLNASNNLVCSGSMRQYDVADVRYLSKELNCATADKRNRISLATKLSRKVEYEDTENTCISDTNHGTQDPDSRSTFLSAQENNDCFLNPRVDQSCVMVAPHEDNRSDEPKFTAPSGQDIQTSPSAPTTTTTKDSELTKNMTSPNPEDPQGQILDPKLKHDLLPSKTVNEEQGANESLNQESNETRPGSNDWLTHYDDLLGKTVFINPVTGLSKYKEPSLEETQVRTERNCTVATEGPSSLLTLYSEWNNPVFVRPPQVAVDVTSGQAEGIAVKIHNILFPYRFTKEMIHTMKARLFVALLKQHSGKKRLCGSSVNPPLEIQMTEDEIRLLRLYQLSLRDLALEISFPQTEPPCVLVERLPTCFVEKEDTEKRRGRRSVIGSIAEEYLREHIEALRSTGRVKSTLPLTVHNILASQACHGAIKFNDELSKEECCSLMALLSSCQLPFQCAHGRPSILPLADLLHLEDEQVLFLFF